MDNQKQSIRAKFIPGAIIGGMKIIEMIPNKTRYKIQCLVCNEILDVSEVTLRRRIEYPNEYGCSKCVRRKSYKSSIKWNVGDIIGDYKLLSPYEARKRGIWNVECMKCHTKLVISLTNAKKRKRPGCYFCNPGKGQKVPKRWNSVLSHFKPQLYTKDERFYKDYKNKINAMNRRALAGTNKKYKNWDLSLSEFSSIIHQNCIYCGAEPQYKEYYTTKSNPDDKLYANGIDRIDSNKGYTVDNCVPCCTVCNRMKLDLTQQEFYNHINKIINYSNKCSTTIESTEKSGSE